MCVRAQPQQQDGCNERKALEHVAGTGSAPHRAGVGLGLILVHPQTWYLPPFPAANPIPQNYFIFFPSFILVSISPPQQCVFFRRKCP